MEVLLLMVMGLSNIACFLIGVSVRQKVDKGEKVTAPSPVEFIEKRKEVKEAKMEQGRMEVILRNIDSYDGSGYGQEDVPGR